MIPKIIHYCWFSGNPLPELAQKCIASWKKYCPDYEIKEWNESNYDVTKNAYMYEAYQAKKWGFVPDYARLDIIYEHGGIYLDTDVELLKPLDDLLLNEAFMGFEDGIHVSPGLAIGAIPRFPLIGELKNGIYDHRLFTKADGSFDITPSPQMNTAELVKKGLRQDNSKQMIEGMTIFPTDYFCPKDFETKKLRITKNTVSIHHFDGSWVSEEDKYRIVLRAKLYKVLPKRLAHKTSKFIAIIKYHGIKKAFAAALKK